MTGDEGPYMEMDGPSIWVPRTVPYLEARQIAKTGMENYGDRLVYVGKSDARLLGFTRECLCEEVCELTFEDSDSYDPAIKDACMVPAWHFEQAEP